MNLQGKKALVTGAARGIGAGCAIELARAGADVAINHRDRSELADKVERSCRGTIIFISSIHSRIPYARSLAYNAGKSGLNGLAFTIANELLPHRINVNVIEPGWIETPGERASFGDATIQKAGAS